MHIGHFLSICQENFLTDVCKLVNAFHALMGQSFCRIFKIAELGYSKLVILINYYILFTKGCI